MQKYQFLHLQNHGVNAVPVSMAYANETDFLLLIETISDQH